MKLPNVSALLVSSIFATVAVAGLIAVTEEQVQKSHPKKYSVTVGSADGALKYFPSTISGAKDGDVIAFKLAHGASIHSITESKDVHHPCTPLPGGMNHTFDPSDSKSRTFYGKVADKSGSFHGFCEISGHCEAGMVFTVNP